MKGKLTRGRKRIEIALKLNLHNVMFVVQKIVGSFLRNYNEFEVKLKQGH